MQLRNVITLVVVLVALSAVTARPAAICLPPSPLPSAPGPDAQSVTFVRAGSATPSYSAVFWREPCVSNPANSALYLRVTPSAGGSVSFSTLFVVQNSVQNNAYLYHES